MLNFELSTRRGLYRQNGPIAREADFQEGAKRFIPPDSFAKVRRESACEHHKMLLL